MIVVFVLHWSTRALAASPILLRSATALLHSARGVLSTSATVPAMVVIGRQGESGADHQFDHARVPVVA
jgi:hypothetical protein